MSDTTFVLWDGEPRLTSTTYASSAEAMAYRQGLEDAVGHLDSRVITAAAHDALMALHGANDMDAWEAMADTIWRHNGRLPRKRTPAGWGDTSTARAYILQRLKRDRPDLLTKVTAGKMTAHAAALEADWEPRALFTVTTNSTPEDIVASIRRKLGDDFLRLLRSVP